MQKYGVTPFSHIVEKQNCMLTKLVFYVGMLLCICMFNL